MSEIEARVVALLAGNLIDSPSDRRQKRVVQDQRDGSGCIRVGPRVGRNQPCPCGSKRKFKVCHGAR
jgi:uncharacterized protein YecA (UPF0149 family)